MAQYRVTHDCGHEVTHRLYGRYEDRYNKAKWLETQPCPSCAADELAQEASDSGWPILDGSEKQVRWALKIRAASTSDLSNVSNIDIFAVLSAMGLRTTEGLKTLGITNASEAAAFCKKVERDIYEMYLAQKDASWWIENRESLLDKVVCTLVDRILDRI